MMSAGRIRVAVTPPSGHEEIPRKAESDLGFEICLSVLPTEALFEKILSNDGAFDLVQVEAWMVDELVRRDLIVPIAAKAVEHFEAISSIITAGVVDGHRVGGYGAAPWKVLFADGARRQEAAWLNFIPSVCNADTLGWRADHLTVGIKSWASLIDPSLRGRVALADMPAVSHVELSLALQASGIMNYSDIGEQSAEEIDATYDALNKLPEGHFYALWSTYEDSVAAMADGPVALQSCWPPAVADLRGKEIPVRYSPLKEGSRGWAGGYVIMRSSERSAREMALAYANWYLEGWAGAYLSRQGYYSAVPFTVRQHLAPADWIYWYEGAAAETDILNPAGQVIERIGGRREGGSFRMRMGRIACWNTRMVEEPRIRQHWALFREAYRSSGVSKLLISQS